MAQNGLYNIIFQRKSVRNYDLTPLDDNVLKEIREHLNTLKPLYDDIETELKIISSDDVHLRIMPKKAPHYIAIFSETKKNYKTNVGFMLQQMDLYLSAKGIGSCWQGIPLPTRDVLESSHLEFIILIAFGNPQEPLHRNSLKEFKRKPLTEITDINGEDFLLEAVRLAPSATNSQPWFFTGDESIIHAYSVKPGFLRKILIGKFIAIDMGIALYHLQLAAEHFGRETEIILDKTAKKNHPKNYEYVASLKFAET